ncbi:pentapeptide repeat-containing protein, partial [Rhodospirillales bacterium]|nr:pentapeptide repeat-containing protein [Rhodospirillales bacterium]
EGRPADLHSVDLIDINLRGVNLSGMNMKNANLHSVNFSDTICMFTFFKIPTLITRASRMLTWMPPILKNAS